MAYFNSILTTPAPGSMENIISTITDIFTGVVGMVSTVVTTVTSNPLLLFGVLFGFCGIAIGLFRRLFH